MPLKRLSSKCPRSDPPPIVSEPMFSNEEHKMRYSILSQKSFGNVRKIDWEVLQTLRLDGIILEYITQAGWDKLFSIEEPTFRELTLEVLSTIEILKARAISPSRISFRILGKKHRLSLDELGVYMGIYSEAYAWASECHSLPTDFPHPVTSHSFWTSISNGSRNQKASQMSSPVHRYIHALWTRSIGGR